MTASFQLLTSRTFVNLLPELGEVYARAFTGPPYLKPDDELASFVEDGREQSGRPGFVAWAAFELGQAGAVGRPVGFSYAYELLPDTGGTARLSRTWRVWGRRPGCRMPLN